MEISDNKIRRGAKTQRYGALFEMQHDSRSFFGIFGLRDCTHSPAWLEAAVTRLPKTISEHNVVGLICDADIEEKLQ
jgi:hypothetical protein